ncbi:MAG TPA: hypothetical protein VMT58_05120 [Candidatus Binataceae bacterium]|nr:hypothetical protein [Candidatus Binataceae bacterium]
MPINFIAFVLVIGVAIGWFIATFRARKTTLDALRPTVFGAGTGAKQKIRTIELQCSCGNKLKFRDPVEPGYEPFPQSDSVACPNCGKVRDLGKILKRAEAARP